MFIGRIGCGCASAILGCAAVRAKRKEHGMSREQSPAEPIDRGDWDISVCGLNCAKCKLLEKGDCAGCRGPLDRHWSPGCKFLPCAKAKGHRYCLECGDFPCDKLSAFASDGYEHHRPAVENMKEMRAIGLEKWIARQPKPMFCPGWRF
jgi:hypothetical protein